MLPRPRGRLTDELLGALAADSPDLDHDLRLALEAAGDDAALALWVPHDLHYRGFPEVDERLEWDPTLIAHAQCARARPRGAPALPGRPAQRPLLRRGPS